MNDEGTIWARDEQTEDTVFAAPKKGYGALILLFILFILFVAGITMGIMWEAGTGLWFKVSFDEFVVAEKADGSLKVYEYGVYWKGTAKRWHYPRYVDITFSDKACFQDTKERGIKTYLRVSLPTEENKRMKLWQFHRFEGIDEVKDMLKMVNADAIRFASTDITTEQLRSEKKAEYTAVAFEYINLTIWDYGCVLAQFSVTDVIVPEKEMQETIDRIGQRLTEDLEASLKLEFELKKLEILAARNKEKNDFIHETKEAGSKMYIVDPNE